ncbi:MAG TPA: biotin--[acetyl-CoA-carboxylase] ligase, partial [Albitalea sp.]|nr:biotin--[acetyl-CoA-carboxylase] ligase [Albitalea sp.]
MPAFSDHPLRWGAEALWEELAPQLPGLSVEVVARIASTNSALLERARIVVPPSDDGDLAQVRPSVESAAFGRRAADLQPCLLVAEHQTHGRGRQGRVWQAAPGASLTFSLGLPLSPKDWSGLSLAVGVA